MLRPNPTLKEEAATAAVERTFADVQKWLFDEDLDRYTRLGLLKAIQDKRWGDITTAFAGNLTFGTAGPRAKMALTQEDLVKLFNNGFHAEILKGPKTVNNVTLSMLTTGVARHYKRAFEIAGIKGRNPVTVITYDSRVHGKGFADLVAAIFLHEGVDLRLVDKSSPMPEMSFAVADFELDLGILISASHNPQFFNGYKVSGPRGEQLGPALRTAIEEAAKEITFKDVAWVLQWMANQVDPLQVNRVKPRFLGPLTKMVWKEFFTKLGQEAYSMITILSDRVGKTVEGFPMVDLHNRHRDHVLSLMMMDPSDIRTQLSQMFAIYSPMYGNGEAAFNRLVKDKKQGLGLPSVTVKEYAKQDGFFSRFANNKKSDGKSDSLIPDPGNSAGHAKAWKLVMEDLFAQLETEVRQKYGSEPDIEKRITNQKVDLLKKVSIALGTDPDSDRLGVVVTIPADQVPEDQATQDKQLIFWTVPEELQALVPFRAFRLLPANDTWTVATLYQIDRLAEKLTDEQKRDLKFTIIKTHVTTDALNALEGYARSKGLHVEIIEPFVGFSLVAEGIENGWKEGKINISGEEESGGFSIGGAPPIVYTLLHLLQANNDLRIRIEGENIHQEGAAQRNPLLSTDKESYYGYTIDEIQKTLKYLADQGLVYQANGAYRLADSYRGLNHVEYWKKAEHLPSHAPGERLGKRGHTMEKDGLMAMTKMLEVAAYAHKLGQTLNEYLWENVYRNPMIGYFASTNQSQEFEIGPAGDEAKRNILQAVLQCARQVSEGQTPLVINGKTVQRVKIFIPKERCSIRNTRIPSIFPVKPYEDLIPLLSEAKSFQGNLNDEGLPRDLLSFFPEEGVRFYFSDGTHLTIRPSGTEPKLRYYVQVKATDLAKDFSAQVQQEADRLAFDIAGEPQRK